VVRAFEREQQREKGGGGERKGKKIRRSVSEAGTEAVAGSGSGVVG